MIHSQSLPANERVWQAVACIPFGKVASYGQIAQLAGLGRGARYVGTVLKQLPKDTTLPWHRVVNAKGKVSFTADSDVYKRQTLKLSEEGILVSNGKVDLKRYGWNV
ncbi:MAG: MGMT family protein [Pontibacterium sp.]